MDKLTLAQWAENLLNDDFFKKVMDDLKNQQISVILNTNRDGIDDRESAYLVVKTLELIEGHLKGMAAEKQIRDKRFKIL
jgi:RNA binding exosome subunit